LTYRKNAYKITGNYTVLSYVYRSAKFDAKFYNFFARLYILFYFRSEKFRTSVNGKKKWTSERKS